MIFLEGNNNEILIEFLNKYDKKIKEFKRDYRGSNKSKLLTEFEKFKVEKILPWQLDYNTKGIDVGKSEFEEIIDIILDIINTIDKILNKQKNNNIK